MLLCVLCRTVVLLQLFVNTYGCNQLFSTALADSPSPHLSSALSSDLFLLSPLRHLPPSGLPGATDHRRPPSAAALMIWWTPFESSWTLPHLPRVGQRRGGRR